MFCPHDNFVGVERLIPYILDAKLVSARTSTLQTEINISNHADQWHRHCLVCYGNIYH